MATLAQLDAARRSTPLFLRARAIDKRLTAAIALGTRHVSRLRTLRRHVRGQIGSANQAELSAFLALWEPCFDTTIEDAMRAAQDEPEAMACVQSVAGMAA